MLLARRLAVMFIATVTTLLMVSAIWAGVAGVIPPTTQHKFSIIATSPTLSVEIDRESVYRSVDADGDNVVGAVFRLTFPKGLPVEGKVAYTFIDILVSVCGYRNVILFNSMSFDNAGILIKDESGMKAYSAEDASSAAGVVYKALCGNEKAPASKQAGSYKI